MPLKTVLETLDGVDDAVKSLYTEADGKFVLDLDGVDEHPDVANLKNAYERVKADKTTAISERDAAREKLKGLPEDFDAEKWAKLKDGKPDEAALVQLRQQLETERDDWKGKYESLTETTRKTAIERDLTDALNAAGVNNPSFVSAARAMMADKVKVGEDGKAFVETDMGPLPLGDHVKRWAAKEGKDFVTPASGGGSKGGTGKGGQKTVTRSEFDDMSQPDRATFIKDGGQVVDAA